MPLCKAKNLKRRHALRDTEQKIREELDTDEERNGKKSKAAPIPK